MSAIFGDLVNAVDASLATVYVSAAQGMSNYVMPIAWATLGVTCLIWCLMVMDGKVSSPLNGWISKGLITVLIFQAASSLYGPWVSQPLYHLPTDLANAVTNTSGSTPAASLDALSDSVDQIVLGVAQAMVSAITDLNIGGALILFTCMVMISIAGSLLEIACVFNLIYAKLGLGLVLGVGPFFVICLAWQPIKGMFFSWLNTCLYFAFLTVMTTMIEVIFIKIANTFMSKLTQAVTAYGDAQHNLASNVLSMLKAAISADATAVASNPLITAPLNIYSIALQMVLCFIPMFLVALEIRTLVSSLTGGSGGSFGTGLVNAATTAARLSRGGGG